MTYNFIAESFTWGNLSRISSRKVNFLWKTSILRFKPPSAGLGATHVVHIRLLVKPIVDFLLVITNFFSLWLRLKRYERKSIENRRFRRNGVSLVQSFRYNVSFPTTPFFLSENYNDRSFIWYKMWAEVSFVLSQFTLLTDGRTDCLLHSHFSHG